MLSITGLYVVTTDGLKTVAAASDSFDLPTLIQTVGWPTAFVILWMSGQIVSKWEHKRALATIEKQASELAEERSARIALQTTLIEQVVPALTRSTDAVTHSTDLTESLARRMAGGG